jgi:acetylornithine deacetylase/succinyl-diaminopimelate desuccinylase-like protein
MEKALQLAEQQQDRFFRQLIDLLRIPSISLDSEFHPAVLRAAEWNADRLRALGATRVQVLPVGDQQAVLGEITGSKSAQTLLVYGHYDVMPADPIEAWSSEPFEPVVRDNYVYARGASDMKAQLVAFYSAVDCLQQANGVPLKLVFLLDGAEESGSDALDDFIRDQADRLACDFCLNLDGNILGPDQPSLTYAVRGIAYFELHVRGPERDLHSGKFGGPVDNPALVLCEVIGKMRDDHGRVSLPGFYDPVRPLSAEERAALADLPTDEAWWKRSAGVRALRREEDFTATELATAQPTLNINSLLAGHTGPGAKTVIPASAMAKISMRLVPDQTAAQVEASLIEHLHTHMPDTVEWELRELPGIRPAIMDREAPQVKAAARALRDTWGVEPLFVREGASVPINSQVAEFLGAGSINMGFGLPDDNFHAPDERMNLTVFRRGIEAYIRYLQELGRLS